MLLKWLHTDDAEDAKFWPTRYEIQSCQGQEEEKEYWVFYVVNHAIFLNLWRSGLGNTVQSSTWDWKWWYYAFVALVHQRSAASPSRQACLREPLNKPHENIKEANTKCIVRLTMFICNYKSMSFRLHVVWIQWTLMIHKNKVCFAIKR